MVIRTYGNIYFCTDDKGKQSWKIDKAEPHICIKLKAIFNKIGDSTPQPFTFINSPENCHDLLWFMERYPLKINEEDLLLLQKSKETHICNINELEFIQLPDYKPKELSLKAEKHARHYQLIGKDTYIKCKRILIGDDIGLGKTLIGILSCLEKDTTPCAIIVQTHMQQQWKNAIEEFTDLSVHIIKKTKPYNLPPNDVYVFRYSQLSGWTNFYETCFFKSAIFDEIQELRISGSNKYEGGKTLSNNVDYLLGLSATPIYNYGDEIFNVLNLINSGCLGERNDFLREWTNWGREVKDPKALGTYLRENFLLLRRTRKEVNMELPPINKIVHFVGYDDKEVQKTEELAKILAIRATSGSFVERGQAGRELDILIRHSTGVAKAKNVAEYANLFLENNEPIILAGWHRDVYEIWLEELKDFNPVMYTGSESPTEKEKAKQAFINRETNLFIISLRSGIGLDGLQKHCNTVIIGELDWSPKVHDQLIGRVDRDGQQEQVMAVFLICDYGSDPLIVDMLGIKSSQSHNIINPLTAVEDQYSDESRIKLLAKKYLDKLSNDSEH